METKSDLEALINSLTWTERHDFEIGVTSAFFNPKWLEKHNLHYSDIKLEDVELYVFREMYPNKIPTYSSPEILLQQNAS